MEQAMHGIVHTLVLDRNGGARAIGAADIAGWQADHGILWAHLDVTDGAAREWLDANFGLDSHVVDALTVGETRPRMLSFADGLLLVLRGVNTNPGADPEDMVSIRVWIEKDRVISTRRRRLLSAQDLKSQLENGNGPRTSGEFLADLIGLLADRIGDFVDSIEDALALVEEADSKDPPEQRRRSLSTLRRQIAAVRRFLGPQRDALDRLYRNPGTIFSNPESNILREEADRITRYLEDLDLARERAVLLQEELLSELAQMQNTRMYVLSIVAAIFLPLTFVTGLLGMNVGGLPGLESPTGFAGAMVVMVATTAAMLLFLKWKNWL
jgi:zinc transporter